MAENKENPTGAPEAKQQQEFSTTQKRMLENWVGETVDPKTNEVIERRIIATGVPSCRIRRALVTV